MISPTDTNIITVSICLRANFLHTSARFMFQEVKIFTHAQKCLVCQENNSSVLGGKRVGLINKGRQKIYWAHFGLHTTDNLGYEHWIIRELYRNDGNTFIYSRKGLTKQMNGSKESFLCSLMQTMKL